MVIQHTVQGDESIAGFVEGPLSGRNSPETQNLYLQLQALDLALNIRFLSRVLRRLTSTMNSIRSALCRPLSQNSAAFHSSRPKPDLCG
jgi:hypothetical protein